MAFSLTLFSGLPFRYIAIRLLLSCCQPLFYPDQNPFAGSGFPSIQSPPVPCGTGSIYHQPVLHRYYGFIRPLLTHCFCFPIQVILRLPLPLQLYSLTQKHVGFEFSIREDVKRSPSVTQESFRNHPCHDHPIAHYSAQVSAYHWSVTSR
jgi:hypothetical protein